MTKTELRAAGSARKEERYAARGEANSTVEAAQPVGQLQTARGLKDEIDSLASSIAAKVIGRQV